MYRPFHGISEDSILYVDAGRIRTQADADKLRGCKVNGVVVYWDQAMPSELLAYLHDDVLAPIIAEARALRKSVKLDEKPKRRSK